MERVELVAPVAGFLGAPVVTELENLDADAVVVGVPFGTPYPNASTTAGCADAPRAVRERSQRLARFRGHFDFDLDGPMLPADASPRLIDVGDVGGAPDDGAANPDRARATVSALLERGVVPICIGGDDSVSIPILEGFAARGPLTVLQVDAHLDFRDEVDGVRHGYSSPMRRASEMRHVDRIVQVGLRGVGSARPSDVADARARGNLLVTAAELRSRGVAWVVAELAGADRVFVSFDCDGLDPSAFPAVSAPSPGGLGYPEAAELLRAVAPRVVGAAFTEFVPALDRGDLCALTLVRLMTAVIAGLQAR